MLAAFWLKIKISFLRSECASTLEMASNQTPTYKAKGEYCCVVGCHRGTVRDKGKVNFFSFPTKNQEKRQLWIKAVKRSNWEPKRWTRICSDHFVGERHREERDHPDYRVVQKKCPLVRKFPPQCCQATKPANV